MIRKIFIFTIIFAVHLSAGSTSDRINGVAQFLIDRANDNYLYIFEKKIKENEKLNCYFPNTVENLEIAGLKELLYSHQLWEESLKKDMDILATRSTVSSIEKLFNVSGQAITIADTYAKLMLNVQVKYKGDIYPVNSIPLNASDELKALLNGFYNSAAEITTALYRFKEYKTDNLCNTPLLDYNTFTKEIEVLFELDKKLQQLYNHIEQNKDSILISSFGLADVKRLLNLSEDQDGNIENSVVNYIKVGSAAALQSYGSDEIKTQINSIKNVISVFNNSENTMTVKVVQALKEIQHSGIIEDDILSAMKKYILFFAQISDAQSADQVNEILKAYTLPSTSFFEKRKPGEHWMISSYLGASGAYSNAPDVENKQDWFGVFAPIGFEYARGMSCGASWSIMISPFDFGYPITLKLNGIESEVEFNQIIAPSIAVSYGFAEYPLTLGAGYQKGRSINANNTEERILLFLAFDMPLWIVK